MFELSTLIVTGIAGLVVGCVIGVLLARTTNPDQQQNRELENRLNKAEGKLNDYQHEVTEHFAETSQLVNSLTQSYKEVHEYLANSALKLTNPDISRQIIEAGDGKLISKEGEATDAANEPPAEPARDWAPKEPGETGQLSEEYGLDKDKPESASNA